MSIQPLRSPATKALSTTTKTALAAHAIADLAPHLHGLDLIQVRCNFFGGEPTLEVQPRTVADIGRLVERLVTDTENCTPAGGDVEVFVRGDRIHGAWNATWQGYPLHVGACEFLTPLFTTKEDAA